MPLSQEGIPFDHDVPGTSESQIALVEDDQHSALVLDIIPLVYNDNTDTSDITNILLIDDTVQEYEQFVNGCNSTTFPIVYNYHSDRNELKELLTHKFNNINRIAFVFHNANMNSKLFLNNQCFFNESETPDKFSENVQFLLDIIRDFNVPHVDYLACNSLEYDNWKQYYDIIQTAANVVIGASNDATGNLQYGGDWVMETTNEDIKTMYFNDSISEYTKTLATSVISASTTLTNANLNNIDLYTWPITITGGTSSSRVVITFGDNITINNVNKYFIIQSDYVTVDGSNQTVTVSDVTNFLGLIRNGTGDASTEAKITNGYSNITVQNIKISATMSTLAEYGGWICQAFFGNTSSGTNVISNCTNNNGIISWKSGGIAGGSTFAFSTGTNNVVDCKNMATFSNDQGGGIVGRRFAQGSSSTNTISNCTNSGIVSFQWTGGIAGTRCFNSASGTNMITNCTNSGTISGQYAGGITGSQFAQESSGTNTISNCTNSGVISGRFAGGIAGLSFAKLSLVNSKNTISNCTNSGTISGQDTGGIAGQQFAQESSGTNTISNCTNNGTISGQYAGGIAGSIFANLSKNTSINTISNCTNSGTISGNYAGGIAGAQFAQGTSGTNTISNCANAGNISSNYAGGIVGTFYAYISSGTNTISNCTNSGTISGQGAGGIAGQQSAQESSGTNTISNCTNSGTISGKGAGGIAGSIFANLSTNTSINTISNCTNSGTISGDDAGGITGSRFAAKSSGTNTITNCANTGNISSNYAGGITGANVAFTNDSTKNPSATISNCYSTGIITDNNLSGGICAGYDRNDGIYSTTATVTVNNCYTLYGNIKAPLQSEKVTFNITNTYEANGTWSPQLALKTGNLLYKKNNSYVWAYPKINNVDQLNSPFVLYSLNPNNSFVNFQPNEIATNQIAGISDPNFTIVVKEKSLDNQEITYQIDSNYQGTWNFNITIPSNYYSFTPINTNQSIVLQNNFSAKYREKSYQLTIGVPVVIKPRIYASNSFDARWWRISPALPTGLKFSQTTGVIRGTPEVAMSPTKYRITSNSQIYLSSTMEIALEII